MHYKKEKKSRFEAFKGGQLNIMMKLKLYPSMADCCAIVALQKSLAVGFSCMVKAIQKVYDSSSTRM